MKTLAAFVFVIFASICASAQDEIKKAEFFAGYSYGNAGVNFGIGPAGEQVYQDRVHQHGFNASGVYNVSRYFGIKGDVSGTYKSELLAFPVPTGIQSSPTITVVFTGNMALYNFLGGVQIKDNVKKTRFKPFAHAMVGAGYRKNEIEGGPFVCITIIPCPGNTNETGFAGAFGGGLDVRLNKHISLRIFQVDYNPIKFNAGTDHNFRLSTGLVF